MSNEIPIANLSSNELQDLKILEEKLRTSSSGLGTILIAYSPQKYPCK
ncbi:MAG: hypothetical protein ACYDEJ_05465 [Desulfitobacteriaceae bacterium]